MFKFSERNCCNTYVNDLLVRYTNIIKSIKMFFDQYGLGAKSITDRMLINESYHPILIY